MDGKEEPFPQPSLFRRSICYPQKCFDQSRRIFLAILPGLGKVSRIGVATGAVPGSQFLPPPPVTRDCSSGQLGAALCYAALARFPISPLSRTRERCWNQHHDICEFHLSTYPSLDRIHARRTAGGHRDHRGADRRAPARPEQGSVQANRTVCLSNIRQLGVGILMYCNDNQGYFPTCAAWETIGYVPYPEDWVHWQANRNIEDSAIAKYVGHGDKLKSILRCPADSLEGRQVHVGIAPGQGPYLYSYGMNEGLALNTRSFASRTKITQWRTPAMSYESNRFLI